MYHKSNLNTPVKTITFTHGYFGEPTKYIHKLQSVKIEGEQKNELYSFSYVNESHTSANIKRESKSVDHWGYYNGKSNSTLFPQELESRFNQKIPYGSARPSIPFSFANRTPDINYTKTYALEKVTFATGGYSKYEYELSRGKGLRVKHMEENDGTTSSHRYYDYGSWSNIFPSYFGSEYYETYCELTNEVFPFRHYVNFSVFSANSIDEYVDEKEDYPVVTELYGDMAGSGGRVIYNFSASADNYKTLMTKKVMKDQNNQDVRVEEYKYDDVLLKEIEFWREPEMYETGSLVPESMIKSGASDLDRKSVV